MQEIITSNPQQSSLQSSIDRLPTVLRQVAVAASRVQSVAEAMKGKLTIGQQQKEIPQNDVLKLVRIMLVKLNSDLHIDNGLTNDNVRSIADRLTTDSELRWWLNLSDVSLLCRRIATGYYGHFYNHFGEVEFNECLVKYCQERTDIHRVNADKAPDASPCQLGVNEVGYTVDKHGNLRPTAELQQRRLPQPPYLYDEKGKRVGDNPKGYFGKKNAKEVEMQRKFETVKQLMKEDRTLGLDEAIEMVEKRN